VFPPLTFLLRCGAGELRDERGRPAAPEEYLEQALQLRGFSEEAEARNTVRKMIVSFFPQRSCFVLPSAAPPPPGAPGAEPWRSARAQAQLAALRAHLLATRPVPLDSGTGGHEPSGALLVALAQAYLEQCNTGSVPCVPAALRRVAGARARLVVRRAVSDYARAVTQLYPSLPRTAAEIEQWHAAQRDAALAAVAQSCLPGDHGDAAAALDLCAPALAECSSETSRPLYPRQNSCAPRRRTDAGGRGAAGSSTTCMRSCARTTRAPRASQPRRPSPSSGPAPTRGCSPAPRAAPAAMRAPKPACGLAHGPASVPDRVTRAV